MVERLLGLGARHVDIGQGDVPWVVLGDVEGNPFCVMEPRPAYVDTGPVAALPLDSRRPGPRRRLLGVADRLDATSTGAGLRPLRHPSRRGPAARAVPGAGAPRADGKNRLHLDLRLEAGDDPDAVARGDRASAAAASSTPTGATCRGGPTPTRPATSSACCLPAAEPRTSGSRCTRREPSATG